MKLILLLIGILSSSQVFSKGTSLSKLKGSKLSIDKSFTFLKNQKKLVFHNGKTMNFVPKDKMNCVLHLKKSFNQDVEIEESSKYYSIVDVEIIDASKLRPIAWIGEILKFRLLGSKYLNFISCAKPVGVYSHVHFKPFSIEDIKDSFGDYLIIHQESSDYDGGL